MTLRKLGVNGQLKSFEFSVVCLNLGPIQTTVKKCTSWSRISAQDKVT